MLAFQDVVGRFVEGHRLVRAGERLLVAVSGGPDSVALLLVLAHLRRRLGIDLDVVHFNHLLRGAESDGDEQFVLDLAARLGVSAIVGRADVREISRQTRTSLEAAARQARYTFLQETAVRLGAAAVATGHQSDDQVETVLLHLLRGTGPAGLRGMLPRTVLRVGAGELTVIRPLLTVSRADVVAFCRERSVTPRTDPTNFSTEHLRNRVRHELLPALERFNPRVRRAVLQLAHLAAEDADVVDGAVNAAWPVAARAEPGCVRLAKPAFLAMLPGLRRHVLRRAARLLLGDLAEIGAVHLVAAEAILDRPAGTRVELPRRLVFAVGYDEYALSVGPPEPAMPPLPDVYRLMVPGETVLPGWTVQASVVQREGWFPSTGDAYSACLDLAKTGSDLVVRARRPGDRFQPLGMVGTKKLQDFFVDAKVPREWRNRVPLICAGGEIVWVVGHRIDGRFAIGPETREVLCLDFSAN